MKKYITLLCGLFLALSIVSTSWAALLVFTDETEYEDALTGSFTESFEEESVWGPSQIIPGVDSVSSLGITWNSSSTIKSTPTYAHSGSWGIYDYDWLNGQADAISSLSSQTLYGVGGWFMGWDATDLNISLDSGLTVASIALIPDLTDFVFLGVIDTSGFTDVDMFSTTGNWGADDFTFGTEVPNPIPEPATMLLLGTGLLGVAGIRRKKLFEDNRQSANLTEGSLPLC